VSLLEPDPQRMLLVPNPVPRPLTHMESCDHTHTHTHTHTQTHNHTHTLRSFIKDAEEKKAARLQVVEEKLKPKIQKLSEMIEAAGPDSYLCGPKTTYADVQVFVQLSFMVSGFFDGGWMGSLSGSLRRGAT